MILPKLVEIWVPHRISGYFQMMDPKTSGDVKDPTNIGSRGGGPALDAYIKTTLKLKKISSDEDISPNTPNARNDLLYEIYINGIKSTERAVTSQTVLKYMEPLIPAILKKNKLLIFHEIELPMGCGYGSSGGGALGIAYGLNILYNLGLPLMDASKYAHIAEVENHTGLGTVGGQVVGGFSISMNPGFPFQMDKIMYDEEIRIVIASFGPVSTKEILTDPEYKSLIHNVGKICMEKIKTEFTIHNFIDTCKYFINETQMLDKLKLTAIKSLINELNSLTIPIKYKHRPFGASLNQLGQSVFCICDVNMESAVIDVVSKYKPNLLLKSVKINNSGPIVKKIRF